MSFDPINGSKIILKNYVNYLRTTFFINDEEYMKKFEEQLHHNSYLAHGPYVDVTESFETGKCISDLISEGILSSDYNSLNSEILPIERPLYKHQERSISLISKNKNAIITTGTGSGKTELYRQLKRYFERELYFLPVCQLRLPGWYRRYYLHVQSWFG